MNAMIELDRDFEMLIYSPVCTLCKHLQDIECYRCAAFDEPIPDIIWRGDIDHKLPFPGDHGIQFEPHRESN